MQDKCRKFYKKVSKILKQERLKRNMKFTIFCYENDIATSVLNTIENGDTKTYFYNIARVVNALGISFEEFGKMLDDELEDELNLKE